MTHRPDTLVKRPSSVTLTWLPKFSRLHKPDDCYCVAHPEHQTIHIDALEALPCALPFTFPSLRKAPWLVFLWDWAGLLAFRHLTAQQRNE